MSMPIKPTRQRRGVILIALLGFVLLMSVLVVQFLEVVALQVRRQLVASSESELYPNGYSAMHTALAVLEEFLELDEGLFGPTQGWADPINYSGITFPGNPVVRVSISDESSKIGVNSVTGVEQIEEHPLYGFLTGLGIDDRDVRRMYDCLQDWIDDDGPNYELNGAEADEYEREGLTRRPDNAPLTTLETLRDILGWREVLFEEDGQPGPLWETVRSNLSVYSEGGVNLNTASPQLIDALAREHGFRGEDVFEFLDGPDGVRGTPDDGVFRSADDIGIFGLPDGIASFTIRILRLKVELEERGRTYTLEAVVRVGGDGPNAGGLNIIKVSDSRTLD